MVISWHHLLPAIGLPTPADIQTTRPLLASIPDAYPSNLLIADTYGVVVVVVSLLVVAIALASLWSAARQMPRGVMLAIALVVFIASLVIPPGDIRELHALTGAMRMFGFVGFIMGIVDLFRKR